MKTQIFFKLFIFFLIVIAAATLTLNLAVRHSWQRSLFQSTEDSLRRETLMLANRVKGDTHPDYVTIAKEAAEASNARATIIDRQGHVLADSQANPAEMENHATRPEFARALNGEIGEDSRSSRTVGVQFLYVAAPIPNGAVRLAYPLASVEAVRKQVWMKLLWGSLLAIVVATILAGIAAQGISRRLKAIVSFAHNVAEGDLTARIDERRSSDEIAAVATALDKTARRLQESFAALETSHEELEAVLNSMQEAVIAVSADGRALWANRKMNELAPPGVRLNAPVVETVRDPDFLRAIEHAAKEKEVQTARVNWIAARRAFSVTAAPMPNGGAVAVLFDLSEVERLEKTRRDFIANVSHELRTPLTSIQGYTETLLDAPLDDASMTHEFLEIIRKNAARMSRLTEDLLTLARVESGEQNFRFHPVPASTLLQNAYETFVEVARSRDVELTIESNTEELVQADEDAIQQVFANLIDNAIKYSSAGAQVFLGVRKVDSTLEFFVRDTGQGIPSEHLPRLFERFYRVDKARSRESGGTGLGLAIVKHIIRVHGGTVRAESQLGYGSEFSFRLPLAASGAAVVETQNARG